MKVHLQDDPKRYKIIWFQKLFNICPSEIYTWRVSAQASSGVCTILKKSALFSSFNFKNSESKTFIICCDLKQRNMWAQCWHNLWESPTGICDIDILFIGMVSFVKLQNKKSLITRTRDILTLWLVLTHDLLGDRHIDDVINIFHYFISFWPQLLKGWITLSTG